MTSRISSSLREDQKGVSNKENEAYCHWSQAICHSALHLLLEITNIALHSLYTSTLLLKAQSPCLTLQHCSCCWAHPEPPPRSHQQSGFFSPNSRGLSPGVEMALLRLGALGSFCSVWYLPVSLSFFSLQMAPLSFLHMAWSHLCVPIILFSLGHQHVGIRACHNLVWPHLTWLCPYRPYVLFLELCRTLCHPSTRRAPDEWRDSHTNFRIWLVSSQLKFPLPVKKRWVMMPIFHN